MFVKKYAGLLAKELKQYLREEGGSNEKYLKIIKDINHDLDKLPLHNSDIVYAHDTFTRIPYEGLAMWYRQRIGSYIQFPNFLSTSKNRWPGFESVYKIKTSSASAGRDISTVVNKPGEAEVLFKTGATFIVTGVTDCIELSEVNLQDDSTTITTLYNNTILDDEKVFVIYRHANPIYGGNKSSLTD